MLNKHYLRALSIASALGCAGFNSNFWNHYILPRSRAGKITDPDVKTLIEYFYPGLYAMCERATAAFEGNPMSSTDPMSETNHRFLCNLREITYFWLQDAVIMLDDEADLAGVPPWKTLLQGDTQIRDAFSRFGAGVQDAVTTSRIRLQEKVLAQQDLLRSVECSWVSGTDKLSNRLSKLPMQVQDIAAERQLAERPEFLKLLFDSSGKLHPYHLQEDA